MVSATLLQQHESLVPVPSDIIDSDDNSTVDPAARNSNSSSSPSTSHSDKDSVSFKLPLRDFVWGEKVVRNALPHPVIPRWLDPLDVDVDDPKELPLCWYGVPFLSDLVFAYARRIRVAVYMKYPHLGLKPGDLDTYKTWPELVKWFEDQSGLTMHLNQVWGERTMILTFFNNHEILRVTEEMWKYIGLLLDDIDYPKDCEPMWYLDSRLEY